MKISKVIQIDETQAVQFNGELSQEESNLVVEIGLNYLIRAGAFKEITEALQQANKDEEAAMGYDFPEGTTVQ